MIEPLVSDGIVYDASHIETLMSELRGLRDAALLQQSFHYAIILSQIHAVLHHHKSLLQQNEHTSH